jgi:hypothetical protein
MQVVVSTGVRKTRLYGKENVTRGRKENVKSGRKQIVKMLKQIPLEYGKKNRTFNLAAGSHQYTCSLSAHFLIINWFCTFKGKGTP